MITDTPRTDLATKTTINYPNGSEEFVPIEFAIELELELNRIYKNYNLALSQRDEARKVVTALTDKLCAVDGQCTELKIKLFHAEEKASFWYIEASSKPISPALPEGVAPPTRSDQFRAGPVYARPNAPLLTIEQRVTRLESAIGLC